MFFYDSIDFSLFNIDNKDIYDTYKNTLFTPYAPLETTSFFYFTLNSSYDFTKGETADFKTSRLQRLLKTSKDFPLCDFTFFAILHKTSNDLIDFEEFERLLKPSNDFERLK